MHEICKLTAGGALSLHAHFEESCLEFDKESVCVPVDIGIDVGIDDVR